jgi:hypothetical protein
MRRPDATKSRVLRTNRRFTVNAMINMNTPSPAIKAKPIKGVNGVAVALSKLFMFPSTR